MTAGFSMVHDADHPIFRSRKGATTLRVYERLSRKANTSRASVPRGHVVVSRAKLGEDLELNEGTVRAHVNLLKEAGLIVLWKEAIRGPVYNRKVDGKAMGMAEEYLVVGLARTTALEEAQVRAEVARKAKDARDARKAARQRSGTTPAERMRGADGKFVPTPTTVSVQNGCSDHVPSASVTTFPSVVGTTFPSVVGTTTDETLYVETQDVDTQQGPRSDCVPHSPVTRDLPVSLNNRAWWIKVGDAIERGELPPLTRLERSTLADLLFNDEQYAEQYLRDFIEAYKEAEFESFDGEPRVRDVWERATGETQTDIWDQAHYLKWSRNDYREGSAS